MTRRRSRKRETLPALTDHLQAETETYEVLTSAARRRTGTIPPELFVRQALACAPGGDWPVQRDALEALVRRAGFCRRDGLKVQGQPPHRRALGVYETRRQTARAKAGGGSRRPYRTLLLGVDPLETSCDCADFQRGALGLCKHGMAVIEHLAARPRRWKQALREQDEPGRDQGPRLRWDPVRPLTGPGDWLERVIWLAPLMPDIPRNRVQAVVNAQRCFKPNGEDVWPLKQGHGENPKKRLEVVESLRAYVRLDARRAERTGQVPSDPVLAPLLDAEAERRRVDRSLASLHHPIYPYQREGLDSFLRTGRLLLADDMGLGKTVQAIAVVNTLWDLGLAKRGLLLVPAALKTQWLREWQNFSDVPAHVVDGSPEARRELYRTTRKGFLIANYELVLRDLDEMRGFAPDLMVLDEAQRIKNWATKTATLVKQLRPRYRLVLTGTPMENRLEELASIMDWVDSRALEPKWRLVPWHTTAADGRKVITGARNLDTLRERLAPVFLRRLRSEVLSQLPDRTDTRVPVTFTEVQAEEHDALSRPIRQIMQRAERRPLTQAEFLKLMQLLTQQRIICNGLAQLQFAELWPSFSTVKRPTPALLRRLDSPKLTELREMVSQLVVSGRRKVVIFSQWRRMLQLAQWVTQDLLADAGLRSAFFSGMESQKRRTHNIVDFHDDPNLMMLLCSDAGGVGLNLQHAASCLINLDLPWNPAVLEQRIGRIHRLGQKHPVQVYHLISEAGIEARMEGTIGVKKAFFDGLFDGQSDAVEFDRSASFLDQIKEVVDDEEDQSVLASATTGDALEELDVLEELDALEELDGEAIQAPQAIGEPADVDAALATSRAAEDSGQHAADQTSQTSPSLVTGAQVQQLLSRMEVSRRPDGGVTIDAPPEAAEALAAIFAGMAGLIAQAAPPATEDP